MPSTWLSQKSKKMFRKGFKTFSSNKAPMDQKFQIVIELGTYINTYFCKMLPQENDDALIKLVAMPPKPGPSHPSISISSPPLSVTSSLKPPPSYSTPHGVAQTSPVANHSVVPKAAPAFQKGTQPSYSVSQHSNTYMAPSQGDIMDSVLESFDERNPSSAFANPSRLLLETPEQTPTMGPRNIHVHRTSKRNRVTPHSAASFAPPKRKTRKDYSADEKREIFQCATNHMYGPRGSVYWNLVRDKLQLEETPQQLKDLKKNNMSLWLEVCNAERKRKRKRTDMPDQGL